MASLQQLRSGGSSGGGGGGGGWLSHLGLGELGSQIKGIVPGLYHLGTSVLPGGTPAGEAWSQAGRGLTNSVLQTGGRILTALPEAATLGKSNFGDAELTKAAGWLAGSNPALQEQFKRGVGWQAVTKQGLAPTLVGDVGNVALGAGAAAKLAKLGDVGTVANALTTAERAGKAGFSASDIAAATEKVPGINARMLSKVPMVRGLSNEARAFADISPKLREAAAASLKAEGRTAEAGAVANRAKLLKGLENVSHPYRAAYSELLRPLSRAATDLQVPVSAAAAATNPVEEAAAKVPEPAMAAAAPKYSDNPAIQAEVEKLMGAAQERPYAEPPVPPGNVRLYRVGLPGGEWYTEGAPNAARATGTAVEDLGRISHVDVPQQIANTLERGPNGEINLKGHPELMQSAVEHVPETTFDATQAATGATQAAETAPVIEGTPPRVGPAEAAIERSNAQPIPEWAKGVVSHLPQTAQRGLARVEGRLQAHEYAAVDREQKRFAQADRRKLMLDPKGPVQGSVKAAKLIKGLKLADGTHIDAAAALAMVGGELTARLEGRVGIAEILKSRLPETSHAAVDEAMQLHDRIPQELMTPKLEAALKEATRRWGALSEENIKNLLGSRLGEKGLGGVGSETASMTRGQTKKVGQMTRAERDLMRLERARDKEFIRAQKRVIDLSTKITRLGGESERLGQLRDEVSTLLDSLAERGFPLKDITQMTPEQIANALPKVPGETLHQSMKRALEMGKALRKAQWLDERQTQVVRNLATVRKAKADLLNVMNNGELRLNKELMKRRGQLAAGAEKIAADLEHPPVSRAPDAWKPVWGGVLDLEKVAKNDPTMARALGEVAPTLSAMIEHMKANGVDPTMVASVTDRDVRKFLFDPVKLTERMREGKTIQSGRRMTRTGAQSRTHTIEALAAAHMDTVIEPAANHVIDFMEKNVAKDIPEGWTLDDMRNAGFIPWDAERTFILTGKKPVGAVQGGPTKMVPKAVGTAIKHMSADYSHTIWGLPKRVTNAWRAAVLTWTPRWYFNNFLGNVALATTGGVRLDDWIAALHAVRTGKEGSNFNAAVDWFSTNRRRSYMPEQVAPEGTSGVGGMSMYSDLQGEMSLLPEGETVRGTYQGARAGGVGRVKAFHAAYNEASRKVQRANEVVDDLARVAVYLTSKRKGMSAEEALTRAHTVLVDYQDLSPFERQVVRSVVPFYAWQKGMLKVVSKFPVDHPIAAAVMLQIGELNNDLFNPGMPDAYKQVVDLPGLGATNTRGINPFQDAVDLMTPQGLVKGINPFVDVAFRNAFGAPDNGFATQQRVNEFGQMVPDTSPKEDLISGVLGGLPQVQLAQGLTGHGYKNQKTGVSALGRFSGISTYNQADIQRFKDRLAKSNTKVSSFYANRNGG